MTSRAGSRIVERFVYSGGRLVPFGRAVPEEVPIAFSYGGTTHAVMMATPADLEDFALGFSLAEGIIEHLDDVTGIDAVAAGDGIDLQITLRDATADALTLRRRQMAGPVGCGLCGIESIEQATRTVTRLADGSARFSPQQVIAAVRLLGEGQALNRETRAVHGAGFYQPEIGLLAIREDVGRHNALDKLCGAVLRAGMSASSGAVVVTSRLSVEMVQKTAALGAPLLIAISAPTALAIETAEAAGITLIGIARGEEFEIFCNADRVQSGAVTDVA